MTSIGHNATAGLAEALRAEDGEEIVFHYVQWHVNDYIAGTMGMPLEIEGAYQRFLMRLYQRGKPLPDDDRFMSTAMAVSLRVWKRIKEALVTLGKIIVKAGCLTNGRFEQERQKRAEEIRKRSEAAQARWAKAAKSSKTSPKFEPSLSETSAKLSANYGKKPNKINDTPVGVHMLTNNQNPITNNQEQQPTSTQEAEAGGGLVDLEGLNGSTYAIRNKVAKWMGGYARDYSTAQQWLATQVRIFGSEAVKEAFAVMETKMASDDIVGQPLKLFSKICESKKREREDRSVKEKRSSDVLQQMMMEMSGAK